MWCAAETSSAEAREASAWSRSVALRSSGTALVGGSVSTCSSGATLIGGSVSICCSCTALVGIGVAGVGVAVIGIAVVGVVVASTADSYLSIQVSMGIRARNRKTGYLLSSSHPGNHCASNMSVK